jgi:hypothetical protein
MAETAVAVEVAVEAAAVLIVALFVMSLLVAKEALES